MSDFVYTLDMQDATVNATIVLAAVSSLPCLLILIAAGLLYRNPKARPHLDRLSFRLMLWTMAFEIGYNICVIIIEKPQPFNMSTAGCVTVMYWQISTIAVSNYIYTCIAVNLVLSVTFHLDTVRYNLERWYLGISLLLGLGIPIFPAALGHFGPDPVYGEGYCYFTSPDAKERMIQFIVDEYLWQILSVLIAIGSVLAVLYTLISHGRETARAMVDGDGMNRDCDRSWSSINMNRLKDQLLWLSIKISLYPVFLIIINTVLIVGDLVLSEWGFPTTLGQFVLYVMWNILYGGKSLFFAFLGAVVDPCLYKAIRAAMSKDDEMDLKFQTSSEQPTQDSSPEGQVASDDDAFDFMTALATVPYSGSLSVTYPEDRSKTAPEQPLPQPIPEPDRKEARESQVERRRISERHRRDDEEDTAFFEALNSAVRRL